MKSKKTIWIAIAAFALLMAGALTLYQKLGSRFQADTLFVPEKENENVPKKENGEQTESKETADVKNETETQTETREDREESRSAAPDFSVTDADGNTVRLSELVGKPIVLNFWASWCGPCKSEMPDFQEAYELYGDEIQFMIVNLTDGSRETLEKAKRYVEEQGYEFPVYFDTESDAAITYGITSIPQTYFIDEEGYMIAMARSMLDLETLQKGIALLR